MDLYLLNYRNYYNRQIYRYDSLSVYLNFKSQVGNFSDKNPIPSYDFKPNDGITTKCHINWYGEHPNYVLVVDGKDIVSRWYVVDSKRTCEGQYDITLMRDLIADYYEEVMNAPMFVKKGYVDKKDPAIFHAENMSFSQIKKKETPLKDRTGCAWIIGYCSENSAIPNGKITFGGLPIPDYVVDSVNNWQYYKYSQKRTNVADRNTLVCGVYAKDTRAAGGVDYYQTTFTDTANNGVSHISKNWTNDELNFFIPDHPLSIEYGDQANLLGNIKATKEIMDLTWNGITSLDKTLSVRTVDKLDNTVIKAGTGEGTIFYRVHVDKTEGVKDGFYVPGGGNASDAMLAMLGEIKITNKNASNYGQKLFTNLADLDSRDESVFYTYWNIDFKINLEIIDSKAGFEMDDFPQQRPTVNDAPYAMFCLPYGDYTYTKGHEDIQVEKINSLSLAVGIATALGGNENSNIYDLQLLPFCPIPYLRELGNSINLDDEEITGALSTVIPHKDARTIVFFAKESSGSFNITHNFYAYTVDNVEFKTRSLTRFWRLCSPNYNGVFEFNPYKNGGTRYINVDYTYKPYQPYIHINPNFDNLYGQDFNDARGLICGGDFSLPIIDDAWIDYQISNKNYNEIFNRQIDSMETKRELQRTMDKWSAGLGSIGGGLSGALSGAFSTGSPYGAIAGGIIGSAASGIMGYLDYQYNEGIHKENIAYARDIHQYELGNIKAQPDALTRVSAYNANNKIFPFIEEYVATEQEEEALRNHILYNGMTIDRIGTLSDYILNKPEDDWGFFQGTIIRLDIDDDAHIANAISAEISKGVYLY